ncbi:MAG TPA: hypothetical protein VFS61_09900 [Anaerolineales bacterium]|nr:hypothetical protein [Anaerolineales bacterium]
MKFSNKGNATGQIALSGKRAPTMMSSIDIRHTTWKWILPFFHRHSVQGILERLETPPKAFKQ